MSLIEILENENIKEVLVKKLGKNNYQLYGTIHQVHFKKWLL